MGAKMANVNQSKDQTQGEGPVPVMQRILDDQFFLVMLGLVVPTVFYTLWGVMEVVTIPLVP